MSEVTNYSQNKTGSWDVAGVVENESVQSNVEDEKFQYYRHVAALALFDTPFDKLDKDQQQEVDYDACDRLLGLEHYLSRPPVTPEEMTEAAQAQNPNAAVASAEISPAPEEG